jgi:triphosphoribosyl-dephospho-CoA synthase
MKRDAIPWSETGPGSPMQHASAAARAATLALHDELALYPKPGLVSFQDTGSHTDMDAALFFRSLSCLRHYFHAATRAGARGAAFAELECLGIAAEQRMLARTHGVNTHRGAIFTVGLLCAASGALNAGSRPWTAAHLREELRARWQLALVARLRRKRASNGQTAADAFGLQGIEHEAAQAFPTLFDVTAPALREGLSTGLSHQAAQLQALFQTMAVLDDTNLAHRGGLSGLRWAQMRARQFLARGGVHQIDALDQARAMHRAFVQRRLSPGGCADVLAAACWLQRMDLLA